MMNYGCGFGGYGFMGFGMIIQLIIFSLIAYAVIKIINGSSKSSKVQINQIHSALLILNEKYANGEISEEEYLRKKELLKY